MERVVINSGSTAGIGFATAAEFLKKNDRIVGFFRHKAHASRAKDKLVSFGPR